MFVKSVFWVLQLFINKNRFFLRGVKEEKEVLKFRVKVINPNSDLNHH